MKKGTTFREKPFLYDGNLNSALKIYPIDNEGNVTGTIVFIDSETISLIRKKINEKGKIQMGACRDNPAKQSLGEMLYERHKSPQFLSYLLPLLEEEGFLTHYKEGCAYWVNGAIKR